MTGAAPPPIAGGWTLPSGGDVAELPPDSTDVRAVLGRAGLLRGTAAGGLAEGWIHPVRVFDRMRLMIGGRDQTAARVRQGAGWWEWTAAGDTAVTSLRWLVPLDLPAILGDIAAPAGERWTLEWRVDLRRSGAGREEREVIAARPSDDGAALELEAASGARAVYWSGGACLEHGRADAGAVTVRLVGRGPATIGVVADTADAEAGATLATLARRPVAELVAQWTRHDHQVTAYGTIVEGPDPALGAAFARARRSADARLAWTPGVGRALLAPVDSRWDEGLEDPHFDTRDACRTAAGLLAGGHREPARELLRTVARLTGEDGGVPRRWSTGGVVHGRDAESGAAFLDLAARYLAWTGDQAELARLEDVLAAVRRRLAADSSPVPPMSSADPLDDTLAELWAVRPDAPAGAVAIAPRCLGDWPRVTLRRLRIGGTVLDLDLRRRRSGWLVRVARVAGPRIVVEVEPRGIVPARITVDDVELGGGRARFEAEGSHDVVFDL